MLENKTPKMTPTGGQPRLTDSKTFWKIIVLVVFAVGAELFMWWAMVREDSLNWWLVTMRVGKPRTEVTLPMIPLDEEIIIDDLDIEELDLELDLIEPEDGSDTTPELME